MKELKIYKLGYIASLISMMHGVFAFAWFLVIPTIRAVYLGNKQFWLAFEEWRGVTLALYLVATMIFFIIGWYAKNEHYSGIHKFHGSGKPRW